MIYVFDDYTPDTQCYELRHGGVLCKLEPQVFNVLAYLLEHRTRVVSKDELLEQFWPQQFISEVTVNQRVMAARKALGDNGRVQRYIKTVHGRGYRFVADVTLVEPVPVIPTAMAAPALVSPGLPGLATLPPRLPETFVGREAELASLQQDVRTALQGERQVIFLVGEAGIGKTTLVDALVTDLATTRTWCIGRGQCIDQYGAGEAYLPLLEVLGQRVCLLPRLGYNSPGLGTNSAAPGHHRHGADAPGSDSLTGHRRRSPAAVLSGPAR